ncbi:MAG TPA: ABC transporter permease, partial [Thermoanaerobaculia bacterium]
MQIGESVRTSYEEVKAHPLRSLLTLFGVILGTLALVVVMSVLDGVLFASQREPIDKVEKAKKHLSRGMRIEDIAAFEQADHISALSPVG